MSIILTRTAAKNERLRQLLLERGVRVAIHSMPLIEFAALPEPQLHALLAPHMASMTHTDWLLVTSPQAAKVALPFLQPHTPLGTLRGRLAAVGAATQQALAPAGRAVQFVPSEATGRHLALELPAQAGQQVLHLTSQLSGQYDDLLKTTLQARGLHYQRLALYHTLGRQPSSSEQQQLQQAAVIALASGSAAEQLATVLAHTGQKTGSKVVAVLGAQTQARARALGFERIYQSARPQLESFADLLADLTAGLSESEPER